MLSREHQTINQLLSSVKGYLDDEIAYTRLYDNLVKLLPDLSRAGQKYTALRQTYGRLLNLCVMHGDGYLGEKDFRSELGLIKHDLAIALIVLVTAEYEL